MAGLSGWLTIAVCVVLVAAGLRRTGSLIGSRLSFQECQHEAHCRHQADGSCEFQEEGGVGIKVLCVSHHPLMPHACNVVVAGQHVQSQQGLHGRLDFPTPHGDDEH